MKPDPIVKKDKELIRACRRLNELSREYYRSKKKIMIDPPVRHGWERSFVLTSEAHNRKDAHVLGAILEQINKFQVSRREDFSVRCRKTKQWIPQGQGLARLSIRTWARNRLPDSWKKYFFFYPNCQWPWASFYQFKYPYLYELEIRPHYIEYIYAFNRELKVELDQLHEWFCAVEQMCRWQKIRGKRYGWKGYPRTAQIDRHRTKQKIRKYLTEGREIDLSKLLSWFRPISLFGT